LTAPITSGPGARATPPCPKRPTSPALPRLIRMATTSSP